MNKRTKFKVSETKKINTCFSIDVLYIYNMSVSLLIDTFNMHSWMVFCGGYSIKAITMILVCYLHV